MLISEFNKRCCKQESKYIVQIENNYTALSSSLSSFWHETKEARAFLALFPRFLAITGIQLNWPRSCSVSFFPESYHCFSARETRSNEFVVGENERRRRAWFIGRLFRAIDTFIFLRTRFRAVLSNRAEKEHTRKERKLEETNRDAIHQLARLFDVSNITSCFRRVLLARDRVVRKILSCSQNASIWKDKLKIFVQRRSITRYKYENSSFLKTKKTLVKRFIIRFFFFFIQQNKRARGFIFSINLNIVYFIKSASLSLLFVLVIFVWELTDDREINEIRLKVSAYGLFFCINFKQCRIHTP